MGGDENNLKLNKKTKDRQGWEKKKLHAESKPSDHQMQGNFRQHISREGKFIICSEICMVFIECLFNNTVCSSGH